MSLLKKSQNIRYRDFLASTLTAQNTVSSQWLNKLDFEQTLFNVTTATAYQKYVLPCLKNDKITCWRTKGTRSRVIAQKIKYIRAHVPLKTFFLYSVNMTTKRIKIIYAYNKTAKRRTEVAAKEIIIDTKLQQKLTQPKLNMPYLTKYFKKIFSFIDALEAENCLFHVMRQDAFPKAIIALNLAETPFPSAILQTPLGLLFDSALMHDLKLKEKPPATHKLFLKSIMASSQQANSNVNLAAALKQAMRYILYSFEQGDEEQSLLTFLSIINIQTLMVFEHKQVETSIDEPVNLEDVPAPTEKGNYFSLAFTHGIASKHVKRRTTIPDKYLTAARKSALLDYLFSTDTPFQDQVILLLTATRHEELPERKFLIAMDRSAFNSFYGAPEPVYAQTPLFFDVFLAEVINYYYSKI